METGPKDRSRYTPIGTHTRQRLIGAIALVVIVVIVVPELLTGPRSPSPPGATPAPQVRTVTIDLAAGERGAIARPPPAAPAAAAGPVEAPAAKPAAPSPAVAPSPATASSPAATPSAGAAPGPAPAPASTAPTAGRAAAPAGGAAAPQSAAARADGAAPQPVASAPAARGWIVQLGSFAGRDNAAHLASDLQHKGYAAFVSEYRGPGRVLYRVRVGPEPDRARAEAIAQRLVHDGYRGSVAPQP